LSEAKSKVKKEAPVSDPEPKADQTDAWFGTGRRKTAIARVMLTVGGSMFSVNEQPIETYFPTAQAKVAYEAPLRAVGRLGDVSASVKVQGGGSNSQLGAVIHGLSRALVEYDPALRTTLSRAGLLRRDPRMRESRHFGLMGARKRKQSPKR
jgi:small subunit ribosomal protein S9